MLALLVISLFVVVQISLPVARLGSVDDARRFGWQMFSAYNPRPEFSVVTDTGVEGVDLDRITARLRADLDLEVLVPGHVCAHTEGAIAVTWDGRRAEC